MISRLLRFSFSTVRAEPWPVPCCLHVTGLLLLRARAGPPERHFLPRGPRPPGAPHYLSRHVLARTCWVMGRTTPLRLLPSSSRSDSGPLSPIYAARQHLSPEAFSIILSKAITSASSTRRATFSNSRWCRTLSKYAVRSTSMTRVLYLTRE